MKKSSNFAAVQAKELFYIDRVVSIFLCSFVRLYLQKIQGYQILSGYSLLVVNISSLARIGGDSLSYFITSIFSFMPKNNENCSNANNSTVPATSAHETCLPSSKDFLSDIFRDLKISEQTLALIGCKVLLLELGSQMLNALEAIYGINQADTFMREHFYNKSQELQDMIDTEIMQSIDDNLCCKNYKEI
jgi:hypothetical protein